MRIGIVDLDTSHPQNWIPIERELGHVVAGVWDGGAVHPTAYVESFAKDHGIPKVYDSLEQMVEDVDCAIVHGCDWDTHVDKARPFVAAGKSVLLDKPMAGSVADLEQIRDWVRNGARVAGGSSLRFCNETRDWLARPVDERGVPQTVVCGCAVDDFNYGIHAYAMLSGIIGPGIRTVQHLSESGQHRIKVSWDDGRLGFVFVGKTSGWIPFYATIATEKGVAQYIADSAGLYRALLTATLPYLAGEVAEPPVTIEALLEPEYCALAARQSWINGNAEIAIDSLSASDPGYDGAAFGLEYRAMRYPPK